MLRRFAIVSLFLVGTCSWAEASLTDAVPHSLVVKNTWGSVHYENTDGSSSQPNLPAISISAAANEYESFRLVVTAAKELKNVSIVPETMIGPKGAKIPAWCITPRDIESVKTNPDSPAVPDPLPDFRSFTLAKDAGRDVWISVFVPDTTPPGDYTGSISVLADGGAKISVPIKLHVWDFALPRVSHLKTAFECSFDNPVRWQGATTLEQKRKLLDLYNKDFWRHRVSPMKPYEFYDVTVEKSGEWYKPNFSEFDKAIEQYFWMFNSFSLPNFGFGNTLGIDAGAKFEQLKIEYLRAVAEHLVDKGQLSKGFAYFDRTGKDDAALLDECDLCQQADGRIRVMANGAISEKLYGMVSIWTLGSDPASQTTESYNASAYKARQDKTDEVWLDANNAGPGREPTGVYTPGDPMRERMVPWSVWRMRLNGIVYRGASEWGDNPYSDSQSTGAAVQNARGLFYPPVRKPSDTFIEKGPVTSVRWEMIREGIEDYDYFALLRDRITRARKADPNNPAIAKAEAALKSVDDVSQPAQAGNAKPSLLSVRQSVAQAIESLKP